MYMIVNIYTVYTGIYIHIYMCVCKIHQSATAPAITEYVKYAATCVFHKRMKKCTANVPFILVSHSLTI